MTRNQLELLAYPSSHKVSPKKYEEHVKTEDSITGGRLAVYLDKGKDHLALKKEIDMPKSSSKVVANYTGNFRNSAIVNEQSPNINLISLKAVSQNLSNQKSANRNNGPILFEKQIEIPKTKNFFKLNEIKNEFPAFLDTQKSLLEAESAYTRVADSTTVGSFPTRSWANKSGETSSLLEFSKQLKDFVNSEHYLKLQCKLNDQ